MMFFNINTTLLILLTLIFLSNAVETNNRRILHQPLSTESTLSPPPPPAPTAPPKGTGYGRDEPFFPEVPFGGSSPNPNQTPPSTPTPTPPPTTKGSGDQGRIPPEPQPAKPAKRVAVAVSVGIVTLGMLSALAFYLYRHRGKNTVDSTDKFVADGNSRRYAADDEARPRGPPSEFLYIGTVEPASDDNDPAERSRYQKLSNSFKGTSGRYRPSPDLQPLPPLINAPATRSLRDVNHNSVSPTATASSDGDETRDAVFYTPNGSVEGSVDDRFWTPDMNSISGSRTNSMNTIYRGDDHSGRHFPRSTKSRVLDFTPDVVKHAIIPFIKTAPLPPPPPPPPPPPRSPPRPRQPVEQAETETETETSDVKECHSTENREMPPTNLAISPSHDKSKTPPAAPPPPPPPPPRASPRPPPPPPRPPSSTPRRVGIEVANGSTAESSVSQDTQFQTPNSTTECSRRNTVANINEDENECSSSGRPNGDDMGDRRPKLKPLHWDKVRATSDKATVWDQLKSSSFQLNEDMMESLFGCNLSAGGKKEPTKKAIVSAADKQHRVLDPKKSQNIAILLRALNVTKDEVTDALLDGNSEGLGSDLFETLVKMAPTKEEEIKLKDYSGDVSKLGAAERFLKGILDVPFAFRRVEAMLYSTNFDAEVKYLTKSFDTLELASEELKNSRLFLKLLEAVLQTGNRMNVGTNRGDAKAFKLDTLLKLVDIKGTDGKTTLLHFVVQEIIKSEGINSQAPPNQPSSAKKEDEFRKHGLQIVSGLSRELGSVKGAAGMDSDVLSNYVSKLEIGLQKIRQVLQLEKPDTQGKFFESMKTFLKEAEDQITRVKAHERRALSHVREVTEYFHGDTAKEEAHPLRIFLIVRDFLSVLDNVCKEVGRMDERTVMGTSTSFRISAYASLPAPDKRNIRHDDSSGDLGMSS